MAYIGTSPSNGIRRVNTFTATANQTSFSVVYADTNYIDVHQNGVLLATDDYTSTTGTTVVLAQGASADDVVVITVYDVFSVADTVSKTAGGTFDNTVTFLDDIIIGDGKNIGSASDVDAIAIASNGVVTFSQNTVGAGGMDLLLDDTISSVVAQYDISSTYINGTYDEYKLFFNLTPAVDNADLYARVFVGGSVQTGSIYAYEADLMSSTSQASSDGAAFFRLNVGGIGGATGEQVMGNLEFHNVNNALPFNYTGTVNEYNSNGVHEGCAVGGTLILANRANVVNGWRFYLTSGNIESGTIKLFGLRK